MPQAQTQILARMADFLKYKKDREDEKKPKNLETKALPRNISPDLIKVLETEGHCMGFSYCHGMMTWLDRHFFRGNPNLNRWRVMLQHILLWNPETHPDPDKITCKLPPLTPDSPSEFKSLTDIFDEVIPAVFDNQGDSLSTETELKTNQNDFLEPEETKEKQSVPADEFRRLELAVMPKKLASGQLQPAQTLRVKQRYKSPYFLYDNLLNRLSLKKYLADPNIQDHVAIGICEVFNEEHSCFLGFDPIKKRWSFYDPNYPSSIPGEGDLEKYFDDIDQLINEMYQCLDKNSLGLQIIHLTAGISPPKVPPFQEFKQEDSSSKASFLEIKIEDLCEILNIAIQLEDCKNVSEILKARPQVLDKDGESEVPFLVRAVCSNNIEIVQLLLNSKADPRLTNADGDTPLHLAVTLGYLNIVACLSRHQSQDKRSFVNHCDFKGRTPLHIAADKKNFPALTLLLDQKSVDLEKKDEMGYTAMMYAIRNKSLNCVRQLIDHGAKIPTQGEFFESLFDQALSEFDPALIEQLVLLGDAIPLKKIQSFFWNKIPYFSRLLAVFPESQLHTNLLLCADLASQEKEENLTAFLLEQLSASLRKQNHGMRLSRMEVKPLSDIKLIPIQPKSFYQNKYLTVKLLQENNLCSPRLFQAIMEDSFDPPRMAAHQLLSLALEKTHNEIKHPEKRQIVRYLKIQLDKLDPQRSEGKVYWDIFIQLFLDTQRVLSHHTSLFQSRSSKRLPRSYTNIESDLKFIAELPGVKDKLNKKQQGKNILAISSEAVKPICHTYYFFEQHLRKGTLDAFSYTAAIK